MLTLKPMEWFLKSDSENIKTWKSRNDYLGITCSIKISFSKQSLACQLHSNNIDKGSSEMDLSMKLKKHCQKYQKWWNIIFNVLE